MKKVNPNQSLATYNELAELFMQQNYGIGLNDCTEHGNMDSYYNDGISVEEACKGIAERADLTNIKTAVKFY